MRNCKSTRATLMWWRHDGFGKPDLIDTPGYGPLIEPGG